MDSQKLGRVFGDGGYITKNIQERTSYNLEKLERILKDAGVWEKILEPEPKKLEELLPSLSPEVALQIRATISKKQVITLKPTKKKGGEENEEETA
jgi:hypothetical protein